MQYQPNVRKMKYFEKKKKMNKIINNCFYKFKKFKIN